MNRYDLQVHTDASPCSRTPPSAMVRAAIQAGLDGIAVTNHDTLEGVADAREAASATDSDLEVISGVEVTTTQGHLLALDVRSPPPQTDPLAVIDDVHEQGGVAILSHPFDRLREFYHTELEELARAVDAVEVANSRCLFQRYNHRASDFATRHSLPTTGGSDAHFCHEVGRAATVCEGPILDAIRNGETRATGRGRYLSGHVTTKLNDFVRFVSP